MSTYSYSLDQECYEDECDSHEEAASTAFELYPTATTVYTGLNVPFIPNYEWAAEAALEQLEFQAGDDHSEFAEDWLPSSNKAIVERVAQAIKQAIEELDAPLFYSVTDVQEHVRLPEDEM